MKILQEKFTKLESMMLVDNTEERVRYLTCSLVLRPVTMGGGLNCGQDVELRTLNLELTKCEILILADLVSFPDDFLADRKVWFARLWLTQVAT